MTCDPFTNVVYEVREHVAWVTLNRPDRLNALSHGPGGMHEEIVAALARSDADPDVRCVVITGAGRAFSSGGDLRDGSSRSGPVGWYRFMEEEDQDFAKIRECRKPVIAAVNGLCYGAGFILAAHADIRVAASSARFGFIEARMGGTGVEIFPFLVGVHWAKFLMLTGELITAQKAQEIGFIIDVIPDEDFENRVADLARRVAHMPSDGVMLNKRMIDMTADILGFAANKSAARGMNALVGDSGTRSRTLDGRLLSEILSTEGFKAFLAARDEPFKTPWLGPEARG
jgi:enoyl-CoA hydratase/carnithine racemase